MIYPDFKSPLIVAFYRNKSNSDGSGVVAGMTNVCCVHGYIISEGEKKPIEGELIYRGYNVNDLVNGVLKDNRYGYEEVAYLLLFGNLCITLIN